MATPQSFGNRIHFEGDGCEPEKHEYLNELRRVEEEQELADRLDIERMEGEGGTPFDRSDS